jgi:hypothetical protein
VVVRHSYRSHVIHREPLVWINIQGSFILHPVQLYLVGIAVWTRYRAVTKTRVMMFEDRCKIISQN